MKAHIIGFMAAALLAGCSAAPKPVPAPPTEPRTFGAWVLSGCTISLKTTDMLLTSTGKLNEQGALELKAAFIPQLTRPPYAQIERLAVPIGVEGSGRHYTFMLPYTPEAMGAVLADKLNLRIAYQRLGDTGFQEVAIPSAGALEALGAMSPICP
jgi:hypothetical protein